MIVKQRSRGREIYSNHWAKEVGRNHKRPLEIRLRNQGLTMGSFLENLYVRIQSIGVPYFKKTCYFHPYPIYEFEKLGVVIYNTGTFHIAVF